MTHLDDSSLTRPTAVLIGFIGKLPLAGMALANLHYIAGLQSLGYRVHYVERQNKPVEFYDPTRNEMTDDTACALAFLESVLCPYGMGAADYSFIDRTNTCHGAGWKSLEAVLRRAEFVIDLGDPTWFDELELCSRRAFVDADPMFTQVDIASGGRRATVLAHYDTLFTECSRIGMPDCEIPTVGRHWIQTWPVVATRCWTADTAGSGHPVTTLMNWSSGQEIVYNGKTYGYKNREFERFLALPGRTGVQCIVALGGNAPRDRLRENGWVVASALQATRSIEAYQSFISGSSADLGIAKHAYIESRSGWFSDRSLCYMARGRPVLHQDTGLRDCLPVGRGVLLFQTLDEAAEGLAELERDYELHSRAARAMAEEHFEAEKVIGQMLDDAGWS